jgi:hypothetical protein
MGGGRDSEQILEPVDEGREVPLSRVPPRSGGPEAVGDEAVLDGIFLILDVEAGASMSGRAGGGIPRPFHRHREDVRARMKTAGQAIEAAVTARSAGMENGEPPDQEQGGDFHVRKHPSMSR